MSFMFPFRYMRDSDCTWRKMSSLVRRAQLWSSFSVDLILHFVLSLGFVTAELMISIVQVS